MKKSPSFRFAAALLIFSAAAASASTAPPYTAPPDVPEKNWEIGVGIGAVVGPDYRGSRQVREYFAPIPYLVYRGRFVQSDRDGTRAQFISTDSFEFAMSLNGNVAPDSHKNRLRADLGLPKIGSALELGPALNFNLSGHTLRDRWSLSLPLRAVFAVGGDDLGYIGYTLQPQLIYRRRWQNWSLGYRTSVTYADRHYHSYFYDIDAEFAQLEYPAFTSSAGYSGWGQQVAVTHALGDWRTALFVRYENLKGATFADSSLVETHSALQTGLAVIWVWR